jgi:hypothetical protein
MRRRAREDAVRLGHAAFPARGGAAACVRGGGRAGYAFDVVVEAFDDVARGGGVVEVGGFGAEDGVFDVGLEEWSMKVIRA